jgi:hypothetical protein
VSGPAVRDFLAVALDYVLVPKASSANVYAPGVDLQAIVESCRLQMTNVGLDRHRFDPVLPERGVATAKPCQVVDAGDLEPHEVLGVVRDALSVGLGEADPDLRLELEAVDEGRLYG